LTHLIALAAARGAVPLGRAGTPRPAARSGGGGLSAGEGARPTKRRQLREGESEG